MHSTGYTIGFVLIMTTIVALLLAGLFTVLKPVHDINEKNFNRKEVLKAVGIVFNKTDGKTVESLSDTEVEEVFSSRIQQFVVNTNGDIIDGVVAEDIDMAKERKKPEREQKLPFYIYDAGSEGTYYIVTVRGNGLWDEIWGNVALEADFRTIAGVAFDHKGETPGLGAEIKDNSAFPGAFVGKKLYDDDGKFNGIDIVKGGVKHPAYEIDVISGATVTAEGVEEMIDRGVKYYELTFQDIKSDGKLDGKSADRTTGMK